MTLDDVAQLADRSPETIYRWAKQGHLGRRSAPFRQADVEGYLRTRTKRHRVGAPPPAPERVAARCHLCGQRYDLAQLALVSNEAIGALCCYDCLAQR
jgi:predicted DNA-binding transcriptional regulator AlpA